ncbi:MAG TPA: chemotaxis protein CheW [Coriobacteriia bacterium]
MGETNDRTSQYVLFRLGEEVYGLPIEQVSSIIRFELATPVPHAPESVDGVINLRGHVIPVVNLKRRLLGQEFEPSATSRIVVAEGEAGMVGLAVDAANEVATIALDEISPAPDGTLSAETAEAFEGVARREGHLVILLNLDKALPCSDYERVSEEVEPDV